MRKSIYLLIIGIASIASALAVPRHFPPQTTAPLDDLRTLHAEVEKSSYVSMEPISVKFTLTIPSTDPPPRILKTMSIRVYSNGRVNEYDPLTLTTSTGEPQALPTARLPQPLILGQPQLCEP